MPEGKEQQFGSIFGPWPNKYMHQSAQGVGLILPGRQLSHADPDWYQLDLDDEIEDPDDEFVDPLPTERHRRVP